LLDGTRNDGKLSRSVRSRGKAGDHIKRLPIANYPETRISAHFQFKGHFVEYELPSFLYYFPLKALISQAFFIYSNNNTNN
jgi:hypothetical protein